MFYEQNLDCTFKYCEKQFLESYHLRKDIFIKKNECGLQREKKPYFACQNTNKAWFACFYSILGFHMDDRDDLDFLDDRKILQKILSISFHDNREENLTRRFFVVI